MSEHRWRLRVYYEDTDVSGVVYHANYLRWFERARTEWLRAQGYGQEQLRMELGIAFTVAGLEIAYLRPARLDDELEVTTVVAERGRASLGFEQVLRKAGQAETVLARVTVRIACVNAESFRPCGLPEALRKV